MIQLVCTHCGHRFEMEKSEGAVCPSCGWSSSVKPAAEAETRAVPSGKPAPASALAWIPGFLFFLLKILAVAAFGALVIVTGLKLIKSFQGGKAAEAEKRAETAHAVEISVPEPEAVTTEEDALLVSALKAGAEPELTDEELMQLQKGIQLASGDVEKLPTPNWTLEDFRQFLAKQEAVYKMPLPRSYKKILDELFTKNYAPAYDLFLAGSLLEARDAYVAALNFPVFGNDLRKHRAVILTMLRDYINDIIAKIGALNFSLARRSVHVQSEQIGTAYAAVQQQIQAKKWNEALQAIGQTEGLILASASGPALTAPPYGPLFQKVDGDIQPVLLRLMQVPSFAFDMNALRGDLAVKKSLIAKLMDPERAASAEKYNLAVQKIKTQEWDAARELLLQVKSPADLKQDADLKIGVLDKKIAAEARISAKAKEKA